MDKKKGIIVTTVFGCLLILSVASLFLERANIAQFRVYGAGTPDSYGNRIEYVKVQQNSSGSWTTEVYITNVNYTADATHQIQNAFTRLLVGVLLNVTLADNATHAESNTRVYANVTGVYTDEELTVNTSSSNATYYKVEYLLNPWQAQADTTYNITLLYQAYY